MPMRTRSVIEDELMYWAKRASNSGDTTDYMDYIQRMQLDLLMDIRDLLSKVAIFQMSPISAEQHMRVLQENTYHDPTLKEMSGDEVNKRYGANP